MERASLIIEPAMDHAIYLPALAALAGSAVGGVTSLVAAWVTQRHQDYASRLAQDRARRQKVYGKFIDEASKFYADALVHDEAEVTSFVSVYALISRMRLMSSTAVIEKAEAVARVVIDTYFTPNKTFPEFRQLMNNHAIGEPLRAFSEECRKELNSSRLR
jgi:hypothetical protein